MCNKTDLAIARMPEPTLSNPASSLERKRNSKAAEGNNKAVVVADNSYITSQRPLAVSIESVIENAGLARANAALSIEKPEGDLDWARQCNGYVCLKLWSSHWRRFDADKVDSSPTTYSILGSRWGWDDLPLGHIQRIPGPWLQYCLLDSCNSHHQYQLLLPHTPGPLVVSWSMVPRVCVEYS